MLYREIIAFCSQTHTKHTNTLCGQNVEFLSVKPGGVYTDQWALEGYKVYFQMHFSPYLEAEKGVSLLYLIIRENIPALISSSPALLTAV